MTALVFSGIYPNLQFECVSGAEVNRDILPFVNKINEKKLGITLKRHEHCDFAVIRALNGEIHACIGFEGAGKNGFFCEQYLDAPLEAYIEGIDRSHIVELKALASNCSPLITQYLLSQLREVLALSGFEVVASTSTNYARRSLRTAGYDLRQVHKALPERLSNPDQWGSFFQFDPWVWWSPLQKMGASVSLI